MPDRSFDPTILRARISACLEKKRLRDFEKRHARSLELELAIGRAIQNSFLPSDMPSVPGWEITARVRSARQVAGDYYDVFPVADGQALALIVADVCDKGVAAALFMAVSRSLLRATATQRFGTGGAPARDDEAALRHTVSFVSDYIANVHGRTNMFATLFFGLLDPHSGSLLYINGGHDAPMICGGGGIRATLPPTGPALGLMPGLDFKVSRAELAPGELLLLYTDGVTDARSTEGFVFGEARLEALAARLAGGSAAALLDAIEAAVDAHSTGLDPFDDITLMGVKRAGGSGG